ncbi:DUF393 domain-containing protein [Akkermansiaceae bacterium]|nr:DUF393 domain-containing protein [Akkermansiaceae bacterium]
MNIPTNINKIEVFYDGHCGMCCTFHEWLNKQKRAFEVEFIPYQSDRAIEVFPEIETLDPDKEMIVRTDDGEIYQGAEAWVICLHSGKKYQGIADKMASPALLPMAKKTCNILAANRLKLSGLLFKKKDQEVAEHLHEMEGPDCENDQCKLD